VLLVLMNWDLATRFMYIRPVARIIVFTNYDGCCVFHAFKTDAVGVYLK
jgi:hypothetical protein